MSDAQPKEFTRVGRGAIAFLVGSGVTVVSGLVRVILLTRVLGTEGYGALILALSVTSLIGSISSLGMQLGVTRTMSHARAEGDHERAQRLLHASLVAGTISGVVGSLIALGIAVTVVEDPTIRTALLLLTPVVLLSSLRPALFGALRAVEDLRSIFVLGIVAPLLDLVLIGGMILAGAQGIAPFAIALLLSALGDLILTAFYVKRRVGSVRLQDTTWTDAKTLLAVSLPLLVTQVMFFAIQRSDVLLLGIFHGADDVGLYAPAMRLVEASQKVLAAFPLLYVPVVTAMVARKHSERIADLYLTVTKWGYIAGGALLLPLLIAPEAFLSVLFGEEWTGMGGATRILVLGYWSTLVTGLNGVTLAAIGEQRRGAVYSTVGGVVNLALGFAIIPMLGPEGAAWANTLSYLLINTLFSVLLYRKMRLSPFRRDTTSLFMFSGVLAAAGLALAAPLEGTWPSILLALGVVAVWVAGSFLVPVFRIDFTDIRRMMALRGKSANSDEAPAPG